MLPPSSEEVFVVVCLSLLSSSMQSGDRGGAIRTSVKRKQ